MILSPEQVRAMRICAQHLHRKAPVADLPDVVRSVGGINAQSAPAMMLSLRARVRGLEPSAVRKWIEEGRLIRTWAMRGTIHLMDPADAGWMGGVLGPAILKKGVRRRLELGLDEETINRAMPVIRSVLADRGLVDRDELTDALIDHGIEVERKSQAPYHLIAYAALNGILCIGPDREHGQQTYRLVDEPAGIRERMNGDEALAKLALRYLRGYGPADPKDFAAWSGLPMADARKGWKLAGASEGIQEITVDGHKLHALAIDAARPVDGVVNLLPAFDAIVLGYADRGLLVPEKYRREVYHGGQTVPVVLVGGRAAGVWRYERYGKILKIRVKPFEPLEGQVRALIREETEDIGRLFGMQVTLSYHPG